MRDMMTEMHHHAVEQRGEHENPECKLCHIEAVKSGDEDPDNCGVCNGEARRIYELTHGL